jgi:hypothetical protein
MEPPYPFAKDRVSVRCCGAGRQFREQARVTSQAPSVHSFDAEVAGGGIWFREATIDKSGPLSIEIGKG